MTSTVPDLSKVSTTAIPSGNGGSSSPVIAPPAVPTKPDSYTPLPLPEHTPEPFKAYFVASRFNGKDEQEMFDILTIARELEAGKSRLITRHNIVEPLMGEQVWKTMMNLLDGAAKNPCDINNEFYEFNSPQYIRKVQVAHQAKAKVRIILEPGNLACNEYSKNASSIVERLRAVDILMHEKQDGLLGIGFFPSRQELRHRNAIDHRKYVQVGPCVLLGGLNAGFGSGENVDMALLLRGEGATRAGEAFKEDAALARGASLKDIYGSQLEEIRLQDNIVLNPDAFIAFLEILGRAPLKELSWQERAGRAVEMARIQGVQPKDLVVGENGISENSRPLRLSELGRKLLLEKIEEIHRFLLSAANQHALSDIHPPSERVGGEKIMIARTPEERQAALLYAINNAQNHIKISAYVLTKFVAAALIAKKNQMEREGKPFKIQVDVDSQFYQPSGINPNVSPYIALNNAEIPSNWILLSRTQSQHERKLHAKILETENVLITGSPNFTKMGFRPRENHEILVMWIFNPSNPSGREKIEKYLDRIHNEESVAFDVKSIASERFVNYSSSDKEQIIQAYSEKSVRHLLYLIKEFGEETGKKFEELLQKDPQLQEKMKALVAEGYHPGYALFMAVGEATGRQIREDADAWKKIQKFIQGKNGDSMISL